MSLVRALRLVPSMLLTVGCGLLPSACVRHVDGDATGAPALATPSSSTAPRAPQGPVTPLLLVPGDFPPGYPATVLDADAALQAVSEMNGVPAHATVDPAECAPLPVTSPNDAAAAIGANDSDGSTITVVVLRVPQPLAVYKGQLDRCGSFQVIDGGRQVSLVTVSSAAAPPINADDSVAFNQTSAPVAGVPNSSGPRAALALAAQIGDIRVQATYTAFRGEEPNAVLLDQVFTAAVLKVHDKVV